MLIASKLQISYESNPAEEQENISSSSSSKSRRRSSGGSANFKAKRRNKDSSGVQHENMFMALCSSEEFINEEDVVFAGALSDREKQVIVERGLGDRRKTLVFPLNTDQRSKWQRYFRVGFRRLCSTICQLQSIWRRKRSLKRLRAANLITTCCKNFLQFKKTRMRELEEKRNILNEVRRKKEELSKKKKQAALSPKEADLPIAEQESFITIPGSKKAAKKKEQILRDRNWEDLTQNNTEQNTGYQRTILEFKIVKKRTPKPPSPTSKVRRMNSLIKKPNNTMTVSDSAVIMPIEDEGSSCSGIRRVHFPSNPVTMSVTPLTAPSRSSKKEKILEIQELEEDLPEPNLKSCIVKMPNSWDNKKKNQRSLSKDSCTSNQLAIDEIGNKNYLMSVHIKIVESITISSTEIVEDPKKKQYVVYTLLLKNPLRTWYTQRRYNEFFDFDSKIKVAFPSLQADLPPKTFFKTLAPEVISFRKLRLESYCQSLLDTFGPYNRDFWYQSDVKAFFNITHIEDSMSNGSLSSELNAASPSTSILSPMPVVVNEQNWLSELKKGEKMIVEIRHHLLNRDQDIGKHSSNAKRIYTQLTVHLNELSKALKLGTKGLLPAEATRRQDMLNDLIRDKDSLTKSVFNARSSVPVTASRDALLSTSPSLSAGRGSSSSSKRVFGVQETDQTKDLDNHGVVQLQQNVLAQQDKDLDKLLDVIKRQKEIGLTINEELDKHNELLGKLDHEVENTGLKISQVNRKAKKLK